MIKNRLWILLLALTGINTAWAAIDEADLLDPDDAFAISARAISRDQLEIQWQVAPGYYMYRHRISFRVDDESVELGEPVLPAGKRYTDEFFGEVETYRDLLTVQIPVLAVADDVTQISVQARSQGCADLGVCYPPHRQILTIDLPPVATTASATTTIATPSSAGALSLDQALTQLTAGATGLTDEDALPQEQAFVVETIAVDAGSLLARLTPAAGYYIYRDKIAFTSRDPTVEITSVDLPQGEAHSDEHFGEVRIYRQQVEIPILINRPAGPAGTIDITVDLQGCKEKGICYPPMKRQIKVELPAADQAIAVGAVSESEQDRLASILAGSPMQAMMLFFLAGFLLAFTPCVFPMVPILSGIIAGQGDSITTRKAFMLSLVYVLAMAITYAAVGVVAAKFGKNLQALFQHPVVLWSFALLFVALSFAMFGFYNLQLPASIQARLTNVSNRQESGTLVGAAIMGLLSALVVGPCVAPALMAALIYIGQTGDMFLGGVALFAMALGMGVPLMVFGTSAGRFLPRAGAWMDGVKGFFGVGLLALALWMLERILAGSTMMVLWGLLFIGSGVYLGAIDPVPDMASGWRRLWKSLGFALLLFGSLQIVGFSAGGDDWLQPLEGLRGQSAGASHAESEETHFKRIKSVADMTAELGRGQPVMLDFYADWCVECKRMDKYTFPERSVSERLSGFHLVQADVTAVDADDEALLQQYGLIGPPAILFFDRQGNELRQYRMIGYMDAEEFAAHLESVQQAL